MRNILLAVALTACSETASGTGGLGDGGGPHGLSFALPMEFAVGSKPSSIAAADFDKDGNLDLVTTNYGADSLSVLLGYGDGTFHAPTTLKGQVEPSRVRIADLNGDQRLDLVVANFSDNLSVFLGQASGGFAAGASYLVATENNDVALADLNLDGRLDVAAAKQGGVDSTTNAAPDSDVAVFLGSGNGTLGARMKLGPAATPASAIAAGDLDGDGKTDLVAVLWLKPAIAVFLGKGDGTFQTGATTPLGKGSDPQAIVLADFDGDGSLDAAVADLLTADASVLPGRGDGTLGAAVSVSIGGRPGSIEARDMDGDGHLDLVLAIDSGVAVALGNGDGTFKAPAMFQAGNMAVAATTGDFNNDGRLDIVVANSAGNDVSVLLATP